MKRLALFAALAAVAAALGVGYASSGGREEPRTLPDPNATAVYVADRFGEPLRCAGKLARVARGDVGGGPPELTPAEAVERMSERNGRVGLSFSGFSCAKDAFGRETGAVTARVTDKAGRVYVRTIPAGGS